MTTETASTPSSAPPSPAEPGGTRATGPTTPPDAAPIIYSSIRPAAATSTATTTSVHSQRSGTDRRQGRRLPPTVHDGASLVVGTASTRTV